MNATIRVRLVVDGVPRERDVPVWSSLLDFLEDAGRPLPAGCRSGHCGSCTVLLSTGPGNTGALSTRPDGGGPDDRGREGGGPADRAPDDDRHDDDGELDDGGYPVPSCLVPAGAADGGRVRTAATAADEALVDAMARTGAVQCGYCSPGIVVALSHALREHRRRHGPRRAGAYDDAPDSDGPRPALTADTVRRKLTGHLCRCTGYQAVVDAACRAADRSGPTSPTPTDPALGPPQGGASR
ncbi:(2Fe-2S)-binding protein [Streptomyces shenzhenensis]|uniref:(2Fe-2S)-binding protein n=1 Tax=Streptomyces shenzhenensis TaxID=943815 RepID=UPI0036925F69